MTDWRKDLADQVSEIDSAEDARSALAMISAYTLEAADGPTRKNLAEMRKLVQHAITDRLLPAHDFDRKLDDLHAAIIDEAFELIRPHLPAEVWEKLKGLFEGAFSKARLREGLR